MCMNGEPQSSAWRDRADAEGEAREGLFAKGGVEALLGSVAPSVSSALVIDLGAVRRNYRVLRAVARGAECAGVVKGDAYGLGVRPVLESLLAEGCRSFFVATLAEARAVRELAPGAAIYVFNGLFPGTAGEFIALGAVPVLAGAEEAAEWRACCGPRPHPAALQIDTGMNRLGFTAAELARSAGEGRLFASLPVALVMSHLACGDEPDHPKNRAQLEAFTALAPLAPPAPLSLANSAGVLLGSEYHFDLVRPGVALYGGAPSAGRPNPMAPVVQLWGRIAQVHQASPGETIGYGAGRTITRPARVAIVSVGYADGYFRSLGSRDGEEGACAWFGDCPAPVLGRVSMDLTAFDVTEVPDRLARRGGFAELLGPHMSIDELAARAGTIGYEVLTNLGLRSERIYVNG
jgi:alanine racemase